MDNCIFCKIIAGDIPSAAVYEDDSFRAIMDIAPAAKGHVIILPKKHIPNMLEIDDDTASKALKVVSKVANAVKEATGCDGINVVQNNGEAAGQTVFHLHFHIIPRFKGDENDVRIAWKPGQYEDGEALEFAKRISVKINNL